MVLLPNRREVGQIALDALGELLLLGANQLQARLPLLAVTRPACLTAGDLRRDAAHALPLGAEDDDDREGEQDDPGPAHNSKCTLEKPELQWPGGSEACLSIASVAAALAVPALAHAEERTLTFTTAPISVPGYGVAQQPMLAGTGEASTAMSLGMEAEVVDANGKVQGRDKVMLHHIVFAKLGVRDYTCGGQAAERFFAEGEERLALSLPRGFGYANKATDRWGLDLHADEPQAAAPERLHPVHRSLRHRRDARRP